MTLTKIDDRGLKYPIELLDDEEIRLGNSDDCKIYHDSTTNHTFIEQTSSVNALIIKANHPRLKSYTGNETMLAADSNGSVELYYNNIKKLETNSDGVRVEGQLTTLSNVGIGTTNPNLNSSYNTLTLNSSSLGGVLAFSQADTRRALIYTESDGDFKLQTESGKQMLFATGGTTNRLQITATGQVRIPNDGQELAFGGSQDLKLYHSGQHSFIDEVGQGSLYIRNGTDSSVVCHTNAAVELYYDGTKKFETTVNGITVSGDAFLADNNKFLAGTSNDLQIFHDGTHSYLYNLTGELKNRAAIWKVVNAANTEIQIKATENAGVELYHDNVKRLETNGVGVKVSGDILVGNGTDLEIKNDSANETLAKFINNAAVELYYNNVRKLETTSNGIKISNSPSSLTSGAIKINTDFANYGHIVVRDSNVNTLAAISVENANDGNNEINYIYRSVDLASSAWANARMSALSHRFQITSDTPLQNEKLVIDTNGILVNGNTNSSSSVTGVRVNTDIINYGGVSVRDASNSTQSNHIACFQAENAGTGADETNVVTRSVNRNSNNWANAKYAAKSHMFTVNNTIDAGIKVRIDSDGLKLGGETAAANAIDDYEEGAWTPDLQFGGSNTGITYSSRYGHYVKIGNQVTVIARINLSSKGSASGSAKIQGLPFATKSISGTQMSIGSIWFSSGGTSIQGNKSSLYYMVARTDGNSESFVEPKNVGYTNEDSVGDSDFGNGTDMTFTITYLTQ